MVGLTSRLAVVWLAAPTLVAAGCFEVPRPDVAFLCGTGSDCPDGYECRPDGCCHLVGTTGGVCAIPDASTDGTAVDSGIDAPSIDAAFDAPVDASTPALVSLLPATLTVPAASTGTLTVTIDQPAPAPGVTIPLDSSNDAVATVPVNVQVDQGMMTAQFQVTGVAAGTATVTATLGPDDEQSVITVE